MNHYILGEYNFLRRSGVGEVHFSDICIRPNHWLSDHWSSTVANTGFSVGGMELRRGHFSVKMYAKTKELGPVGVGGCAASVLVLSLTTRCLYLGGVLCLATCWYFGKSVRFTPDQSNRFSDLKHYAFVHKNYGSTHFQLGSFLISLKLLGWKHLYSFGREIVGNIDWSMSGHRVKTCVQWLVTLLWPCLNWKQQFIRSRNRRGRKSVVFGYRVTPSRKWLPCEEI